MPPLRFRLEIYDYAPHKRECHVHKVAAKKSHQTELQTEFTVSLLLLRERALMYVALRARFFWWQGFIDIPLLLCVLPIIKSPNSESGALHPPKAKDALFTQKPMQAVRF